MKYTIKEVLNSLVLADLISLLNEHTHSETDCTKETYINNVIRTMYLNTNYRMTVLYESDKAIGLFMLRLDNFIMNEIVVLNIYITKEYQGKKCIQLLIDDAGPIMLESGAKRIKWDSYTFDTEFWDQHAFGVEINSYKTFYISLDTKTADIYKKRRSKNDIR